MIMDIRLKQITRNKNTKIDKEEESSQCHSCNSPFHKVYELYGIRKKSKNRWLYLSHFLYAMKFTFINLLFLCHTQKKKNQRKEQGTNFQG